MPTIIVLLATLSSTPGSAGAGGPGPALAPSGVSSQSVAVPAITPERPPRRGIGMIVSGAVLTAFGVPLMITSASLFAAQARCEREQAGECWAGLGAAFTLPFGLVGLAAGVPLLAVGVRRNRAWRAWQEERGLVLRPQFGRSGRAWTMGVTLQF